MKIRAVRCLVLASAFALTACTTASREGPEDNGAIDLVVDTPPAHGEVDSVRWAVGAEPSSLDWVYAYDYPPNTVVANLCESLLRVSSDWGVQPALAETVDHPDPTTYVYTIRQGVKFHDGSTMTADDVVYSLQRHRDPDVGSYWSSWYANVKAIEASGPNQVTVTLKRPDALFNAMMATPAGVVGSKAYLQRAGSRAGTPDGGMNCTGPFQLDSWTKGTSIKLSRFDDYWDSKRAAKSEELEFSFVSDPATLANALATGQLDGSYNVSLASLERLRSSGQGILYLGPSTSTCNLVVSDLEGPLADVRIRRALSLAIDRKALVKAGLAGYGEPSRAVAAKLTWGSGEVAERYAEAYSDLPSVDQDLDEARRLVAEAGKPTESIVVAMPNTGVYAPLLATEVQAAGERIGVDVTVRSMSPGSYSSLFGDPKARDGIDLFFTTWYADTADPLNIYMNWHSTSFNNYGGWSNERYDRLYVAALAESDPLARSELTRELQHIVSHQLLWIPLTSNTNALFMNNRITGAPASNAYLYYPWAAQIGAAR